MSKLDDNKTLRRSETKKYRTRFLTELEQLKRHPLYQSALDEVISSEYKSAITSLEVDFNVEFSTYFGEKVAVVGGHDALGNWDPLKSVEMYWTEGNIWKCTINFEMCNSDIPYKYICINSESVLWEEGLNKFINTDHGEIRGTKLKISCEDRWRR